jgi:hypothetical protein
MCAIVSWEHDKHDLYVRVGAHRDHVPALVTVLLKREGGYAMTDDPVADLLRLESDLRRYARFLSTKAADAEEEMEYGRDSVTLATGEVGRHGRRHHRLALEYLATAATLHMLWRERERHATAWLRQVRQFVIDANVPDGPLAEAAAGWRRGPEPPTFVTVFDNSAAFVAADTRRADPEWWAHRIDTVGGVVAGSWWRRDGDDDDRVGAPLPWTGRWQVAYLPRTGEVYATRRTAGRPEQVWLLSSHWPEREATEVLDGLMTRMGEPNSLILVAEALHSVRAGDRSATRLTGSPRRTASPTGDACEEPPRSITSTCQPDLPVTSSGDDAIGQDLMMGV